ncbi:uncharacterized protein RCH25_036764 [Pelodytes ibericus]
MCGIRFLPFGSFPGADTQSFLIKNTQLEKCIHVSQDRGRISVVSCKLHSLHQQWLWDPDTSAIMNAKSKECLTVQIIHELPTLKMMPCQHTNQQTWSCDKTGHVTLQGHGLYLSAQQGTKKIFVSKERDKFSRWKTSLNLPVCLCGFQPTQRYEQRTTPETQETTEAVQKATFPGGTETMKALPSIPSDSEAVLPTEPAVQGYMPDNADQQFVGADGNFLEIEYEIVQSGFGWRAAMLVLSPLALILGGIILVLNVQLNKKRKLLSKLPSESKTLHKTGPLYQQCPLCEKADPAISTGPDPNSPTLRHGEILIEWKDGTVTPLFDPQQNCVSESPNNH